MAENVAFIEDLEAVVKKHYPDGRMAAADVAVYFGIVIAAAVANQPERIRDRAARTLAQMIRHPDRILRQLGD